MNSRFARAFEPLLKTALRAWWRVSRPMTLGVRGIACDAEGRVLLIRHTYRPGWFLPGGGVERGETAPEALAREMAQEGGVAVEGAAMLFGFYSNHAVFKHDHVALYRVTAWRPCATHENGEIAERAFFPLDALPEGVTGGTKRRLAEVFGGAETSAEW